MAWEFDCQRNHKICTAPNCLCPRKEVNRVSHCEKCGYTYSSCWVECPKCQQSKDKKDGN